MGCGLRNDSSHKSGSIQTGRILLRTLLSQEICFLLDALNMICLRYGILYLVHSSSSGTDELSCIYWMNEAIRSELLHRACRLRSARGTIASAAAPTSAVAVATAAAVADVDTDCLLHCASNEESSATNVCASYRWTTRLYSGVCTNVRRR